MPPPVKSNPSSWVAVSQVFVCTRNLYVEILVPSVMIVGSGDLGRQLGHEGGECHDEISALVRRDVRGLVFSLSLSRPWEDTVRRWLPAKQKGSPHQTLDPPTPWSWTSSLWSCEKQISVAWAALSVEFYDSSWKWLRCEPIHNVTSFKQETGISHTTT